MTDPKSIVAAFLIGCFFGPMILSLLQRALMKFMLRKYGKNYMALRMRQEIDERMQELENEP